MQTEVCRNARAAPNTLECNAEYLELVLDLRKGCTGCTSLSYNIQRPCTGVRQTLMQSLIVLHPLHDNPQRRLVLAKQRWDDLLGRYEFLAIDELTQEV